MAKDSDLNLYNKTIYQIFPRQYSSTHDFKGVEKDLQRIKDLGSDIVYLLPIHPIGQVQKKENSVVLILSKIILKFLMN